jgi:hypothetical protein
MLGSEAESMEIDGVSVVTEDFVKILVTISSNQLYNAERSFPKSLTIRELKVCMYNILVCMYICMK